MIKKNTKAIFIDGDYKGEYDWESGIPLTKGEILVVKTNSKSLQYKLTKKETAYDADSEDQNVRIIYTFELE